MNFIKGVVIYKTIDNSIIFTMNSN